MEWQPIETAPKDGRVIRTDGPEGQEAAWWADGPCEWLDLKGKYLAANPTHWMPLPPPPTTHEETDQ